MFAAAAATPFHAEFCRRRRRHAMIYAFSPRHYRFRYYADAADAATDIASAIRYAYGMAIAGWRHAFHYRQNVIPAELPSPLLPVVTIMPAQPLIATA